jgi:hypothetical protein
MSFIDIIDNWGFPQMGVPQNIQNGWFTVENPIKMDHSWVPLFLGNLHIYTANWYAPTTQQRMCR